MISASEPLNLLPQHMVILTISYLSLCQESPVQSDSQVNLTQISENLLQTLSHSQDLNSSCVVLLHLPQEVLKYIELLLYQNLLNKCLMLKTWCVLPIQDMEDILLPPLCSEVECLLKRLTNKCLTFKIKMLPISANGSQIILNHLFVIFHQKVSRCL